jgi:hypothetical protein
VSPPTCAGIAAWEMGPPWAPSPCSPERAPSIPHLPSRIVELLLSRPPAVAAAEGAGNGHEQQGVRPPLLRPWGGDVGGLTEGRIERKSLEGWGGKGR